METKKIDTKEMVGDGQQTKKKINLIIETDYQLWEFLFRDQPKKRKRHTKAEAFYDLIKRQREALLIQDETYLTSTVSDFMEQWTWSRQNVNIFLEELEKIRAITLERGNKTIKFQITNVNLE
ncbi:hypothetical protein ABVC73_13690 [Prevotella melaninogenica]